VLINTHLTHAQCLLSIGLGKVYCTVRPKSTSVPDLPCSLQILLTEMRFTSKKAHFTILFAAVLTVGHFYPEILQLIVPTFLNELNNECGLFLQNKWNDLIDTTTEKYEEFYPKGKVNCFFQTMWRP